MSESVIALRYESVDVRPRAGRFALWTALVVGIVSGTLYWLASFQYQIQLSLLDGICWTTLGAAIVVLAALLRTTPDNAIRLSRSTSSLIILGASVVLYAAALAWTGLASPLEPGFAPFNVALPITVTQTSSQFTFAGRLDTTVPGPPPFRAWTIQSPRTLRPRVASTLAAIATTVLLLFATARDGRSAWWAVLFAWHPLTILQSAAFGDAFMIIGPPVLVSCLIVASMMFTSRIVWIAATCCYLCALLVTGALPATLRPSVLLLALALVPFLHPPFGWTGLMWCATVVASLLPRMPLIVLAELLPVALAVTCEVVLFYRCRMNGNSRDVTSAGAVGIP